jgi:hypothetical protein
MEHTSEQQSPLGNAAQRHNDKSRSDASKNSVKKLYGREKMPCQIDRSPEKNPRIFMQLMQKSYYKLIF